jgi:hypothetical protein
MLQAGRSRVRIRGGFFSIFLILTLLLVIDIFDFSKIGGIAYRKEALGTHIIKNLRFFKNILTY